MLLSWTLTHAEHLELIPKNKNCLFHALALVAYAHRAHATFVHKFDDFQLGIMILSHNFSFK